MPIISYSLPLSQSIPQNSGKNPLTFCCLERIITLMCIKRRVPLSLAMLNMVTIQIPWDDVPPRERTNEGDSREPVSTER